MSANQHNSGEVERYGKISLASVLNSEVVVTEKQMLPVA